MAENILLKRDMIKEEDTWCMEDLYANDELWQEDARKAEKLIEQFPSYKGNSCNSAQQLYEVLSALDTMNEKLEKVYVYANQKYHEDTGNAVYQSMSGKAQTIMAKAGEAVSFLEPELLSLSEDTLANYLESSESLRLYQRYLSELMRTRSHVLSAEMEEMLAKIYKIAQGPKNTFSMFNNADLKFGSIHDESGNLVPLTHGRYVRYLESKNRDTRKEAFLTLYKKYDEYKNTLAALMYTNVQQNVFYAKVRNYPSALAAALAGGNIPISVYENLIAAVENHLPAMYRYIALRKQVLGVDELHMYDVYVPMVADMDQKIPFSKAKETVRDGLSVLGEDYLKILDEGFQNRWIDVYENEGKRSGAYSWGAYGTHPYVLLNYNESLNHVFTLAHEMGHAIHSYHSDNAQPYVYAGYRIFVAEVASTCNEALLIHYMIEKASSKEEKAYLINYFLDQFKGTLYRQTMFAEFEKKTHEMVEQGESLNAEVLNTMYYELNKKYFGPDMVSDPEIALEWSRIPHFYTPFYVYQYATGFSAAIAISKKILNKEPGILDKYKQFLSGGSSMDPIDLLKLCDVDMSSPTPVDDALTVFEEYLDMLTNLMV